MNRFKATRNSLDLSGLVRSDCGDSGPSVGRDSLLERLNKPDSVGHITLRCVELMTDIRDTGR